MKKPEHILFLARWYPNRYDPMPGLFIRRHAQSLALKRNVAVIYLHPTDDPKLQKMETVVQKSQRLLEVLVYYPQKNRTNGLIAKFLSAFSFVRAMRYATKRLRNEGFYPDFIHVHVLTRLAVFALYYRIFKGIPYGITEHWSRYLPLRNEFGGRLRVMLTRLAVKHSTFVTTVTHNLAEAMQKHRLHNPRYVILPNVVDTHLFRPEITRIERPFTFVHVSCFEDRSKNTSGLLRSIAHLAENRQDFRFVLVGEGQDEAAMHRLADELRLQPPTVVFTGLLEADALSTQMCQSDALVLFSNYENLPVVIPEAFACGLPVIATRVGGIPEVINEQNGILVDARDEDALTAAMEKMISEAERYDKSSIRKSVETTNSMEAVSDFLCTLYDKAIPAYEK